MILYGKQVAEKIYKNLQKEIEAFRAKKITPSLAVVLIGENPASLSYITVKEKVAARLGIDFRLFHLPGFVQEREVKKLLEDLNHNKFISGIIVQLPLPKDFDTENILKKISPLKDIDGFCGKFPAPTAQAILEILQFYKIFLKNKKIVLVGHGRLVGKPLEKLLLKNGLKPQICDSKTKNLKNILDTAEIIISAVGVSGLIKPEMVNKNAIVIDAGTSESKGKMAGDVDPAVYPKVRAYSPVPGGVGPVTVACLLRNVIEAAKRQE